MEDRPVLNEVFDVEARNFTTAGEASGSIKRILKRLGISSSIMRSVAIAAYEVELNLVIHSLGGQMELIVDPSAVWLNISDRGPGIANIDLAMSEGYSTATEDVRMMGFGAGMGLPNMRRNATEFTIESEVGVGTNIHMKFDLA